MNKEAKDIQVKLNALSKCVQCGKEMTIDYLCGDAQGLEVEIKIHYCNNEECPNYKLYQY